MQTFRTLNIYATNFYLKKENIFSHIDKHMFKLLFPSVKNLVVQKQVMHIFSKAFEYIM